MTQIADPIAAITAELAGERLSRWYRLDQDRIDAFARLTEDEQFIHIDPARAADTPFGGTVAHGFLTLSMLSAMAYDVLPALDGEGHSVNYGFDRIRFLSPVRAGSRIRGRFTLADATLRRPGEIALSWDVAVKIEGADRPALAARWINLHLLQQTG